MFYSIPLAKSDKQDLFPCDLGHERCISGHSFGPSIRNYHLVHYVVSGSGTLYKEGQSYPVKAGQIFVIYPREVTTYTADEKDPWQYIWIGFSGKMAERLDALSSPVQNYSANTFFELLKASDYVSTREEFVISKLYEMMSVLFESKQASVPYEQQVINLVQANYMLPITVESISETINVDRRYLSRIFKKRRGQTISEYLIRTRLKHASKFLSEGYPVAQAGSMAGYPDPFNFSKMFKKVYGVSPQEFRRSHQKNEKES
ncbi:MAG: AraC family transcriptional regulator [Ruminococcaceae bacterium]|nr:AraC family transcriptional regulator [Oscillospiraceae bacterium]